jgi:hypothetical protein
MNLNEMSEAMKTPAPAPAGIEGAQVYNFKPYRNDMDIEIPEGQRVAKMLYNRNPKTGKVAGENSYILIPDSIDKGYVLRNIDTLAPYIIAFLQEHEKEMIKEYHKNNVVVNEYRLGHGALMTHLEAKGKSGALTKEEVGNWFVKHVSEKLGASLAEKFGIDDENDPRIERLIKMVNAYKATCESLSSGKGKYKEADVKAVKRELELIGVIGGNCGHEVGIKMGSRVDKILEGFKEIESSLDMEL